MDVLSISVVVPVYNGEETLARTIYSILKQSHPVENVIIVDDGSTDKTQNVARNFPSVTYLYQRNSGPAKARNQGAALADTDVVFFTDSDCIPQANWIEKAMSHFENPRVAVVSGSYGIANPQNLLAYGIQKEIEFRHHVLMPKHPKSFGSYNFGIRTKVFRELGGFETKYRQASGEDNDLSYKVIKAGHLIYFERKALVDHYHTTQLAKYLKEQFRHGFWRVKMYRDHPHMMAGDDYTFWKDIIEPVVVLLFLIDILLFSTWFPFFFKAAIVPILFLGIINLYYSWRMMKGKGDLFYAGVMFMRAFARTFGFIAGVFSLIGGSSRKKQ